MTKSLLSLLLLVGVLGFCCFADAQEKVAPPRKQLPRTAISSDDINRKFVVIGPLGIPLGEMATVDGIAIVNQGKGATNLFQITSVNGRVLTKSVTMPYRIWPWSDVKKLDARTRYRVRVYQDGGFAGVPDQAMKETTYVQTQGYHFVTSLVVVRNASAAAPKHQGR